MTRIELENGKYTVCHDNGSNFHALRNGEPWRSLAGDKLVFCMAAEIERLQDQLKADRENWARSKLDLIATDCLTFAQNARAKWTSNETADFAIEMAWQYGAGTLDDDCKLLVITADNMVNIMAALGFEHRSPVKG